MSRKLNYYGSYSDGIIRQNLIQWLKGGANVDLVSGIWGDSSGNSNDATLPNGATANANNVLLDGVSQYVNLPLPSTDNYTMTVYLRSLSVNPQDRMLQAVSGSTTIGWNLNFGGRVYSFNGTTFLNTGVILPVGTRYSLTYVRDLTSLKTYYNDNLVLTQNHSNVNNGQFTNIGIGNKQLLINGNFHNCEVYSFLRYDTDLTASQIAYNNSKI